MTNKLGELSEQEMDEVLERLTGMRKSQLEKLAKRLWSDMEVPFTLEEGLRSYTKSELDDIRKYLRLTGVSSLKKADLLDVLREAIPNKIEEICEKWDDERLSWLLKIADNGGKITVPSSIGLGQARYLRATGFVFTGTYQGKKILAVPSKLVDPIKALKNNFTVRSKVKRNTEWLTLLRGLLYYYGTLNGTQLIKLTNSYTSEPVDVMAYFQVIDDANAFMEDYQYDRYGFSDQGVENPDSVVAEHRMRKDLSFYPFSKQQVLTAGQPGFIERNKSYVQLVKYLTDSFEIDKEEVDEIVDECVFEIQNDATFNDVFQYFSNLFEFEDINEVQALMDHVTNLMNNTRLWVLKGYTPTELAEQERKHLQPLPTKPYKTHEPKEVVKVGRNEPCRCGSGKKYKKCCGG
ncbi:SEC-C metal-binding domain-containing protein [Aquibacillus kalidii]|uniref:SEC-C metal-binding domain-containing protein n=1 Tax=Aquibacillus kalidii TaxID=2762597 RepID=UPI0016464B1E|nr:SEC-C metal-binding domain-containing protein [Aquibacillus kalidii]